MKRFLLFAGDSYYPAGGWDDFRGDFNTQREACEAMAETQYDWFQVVDSVTMEAHDYWTDTPTV